MDFRDDCGVMMTDKEWALVSNLAYVVLDILGSQSLDPAHTAQSIKLAMRAVEKDRGGPSDEAPKTAP